MTLNVCLKYLFVFTLAHSAFTHPQETEKKAPEVQKEQLSTEHYVTHWVTGIAANIAHIMSTMTGLKVGDAAVKAGLADWIGHQRGITPPDERCEDYGTIATVIGVPTLLGGIAGLYIVYKTPQWTDKYILKKKTERTSKQNFIVFLHRMFIPFGSLTGEYFTH